MASNQRTRGLTHLCKQLASQTSRINPSIASSASTYWRASSDTSGYDKNLDDNVHSSVVPDDVVQPPSDNYWTPHPQTGVFGPTAEHTSSAGAGSGSSPPGGGGVMEEKAWFRPVEDLEKPQPTADET